MITPAQARALLESGDEVYAYVEQTTFIKGQIVQITESTAPSGGAALFRYKWGSLRQKKIISVDFGVIYQTEQDVLTDWETDYPGMNSWIWYPTGRTYPMLHTPPQDAMERLEQ